MKKVFNSINELQSYLEKTCAIAVENTCNRLLGRLQNYIISEYYDAYDPSEYKRTMQFYRSAMTKMLSNTCGEIFMNPEQMNYPFSGRGWSWDGATQIFEANQGSHGGWTTEESVKHRYFYEFENYCEKNAIKILKEELKKQGIS